MPEYTAATVAVVALVLVVDLVVLRTRLVRTPTFWASLAIMWSFQVLVDGWLTKASAPIVRYDPEAFSGVRIFFHSPVEDFGFGFALILATLSVWEALGRRHRVGGRPADGSRTRAEVGR